MPQKTLTLNTLSPGCNAAKEVCIHRVFGFQSLSNMYSWKRHRNPTYKIKGNGLLVVRFKINLIVGYARKAKNGDWLKRSAAEMCLLNAVIQKGGSIHVGLLDQQGKPILGRSLEDCIPLKGDHRATTVK